MKLKSLIMFSAAALAFAACSNEEDVNGGIKGDATVTVNIQDAITRALEQPTTGTNNQKFPVEIESITLTLEAGSGQQQITKVESSGTYTFNEVRNPQSLTVVINEGKASGLTLEEVYDTGLAEPLYATTTNFTQTSETTYTATLEPEHRLARLQFSGIKHVDVDGTCAYNTLTIDGVFMNYVQTTEGQTGAIKSISIPDYTTANTVWTTVQTWTDAPVWDAIADGSTFLTDQTGWPRDGQGEEEATFDQCYAYNIFPAGVGEAVTNLPKFTVCFSNAAYKPGYVGLESLYRFASVAKYIIEGSAKGLEGIASDGKTIETFKAGYIYNITKLEIDDEDLGYTPDGGQDATLTATVEVLPWTLVNGTVEWN